MSGKLRNFDNAQGDDYERERLLENISQQESDEEFVLRNAEGGQYVSTKLQEVRQQVEDVTSVMRENVNKLFTRSDRLDELNERSENLRSASDEFYSASARLKKTMWWQGVRTRAILGSLGILIVIVMIIWLTVKYH